MPSSISFVLPISQLRSHILFSNLFSAHSKNLSINENMPKSFRQYSPLLPVLSLLFLTGPIRWSISPFFQIHIFKLLQVIFTHRKFTLNKHHLENPPRRAHAPARTKNFLITFNNNSFFVLINFITVFLDFECNNFSTVDQLYHQGNPYVF